MVNDFQIIIRSQIFYIVALSVNISAIRNVSGMVWLYYSELSSGGGGGREGIFLPPV